MSVSCLQRHGVTFITWGSVEGRAREIAAQLDGSAWTFRALSGLGQKAAPLRYAVNAIRMICKLLQNKPRAIIVTNPPIVPALIGWLYSVLTGACVILDSHPGSFGLQGDTASRKLVGLHRWLTPRVAAVLVTDEALASRIRAWGGTPQIVHEAPPLWLDSLVVRHGYAGRPQVLFVGVFGGDEPVSDVIDAAALTPEADFLITGDVRRCPAGLLDDRPANVRLLGYLNSPQYEQTLGDASVVLTLSTEPSSVMRAAYEAVYAMRPLVVSDWETLRQTFPSAIHVHNDGPSISAGIKLAIANLDALETQAAVARELQMQRWSTQLDELQTLLSTDRQGGEGLCGS